MKLNLRIYVLIGFVVMLITSMSNKMSVIIADNPPIILSSRWFHPTNEFDTLNTLKMVDLYKPDQIDWMYCTNEEQLSSLKRRGVKYSLALNPQVPDSGEYTVNGRIKDIDGNRLLAPWMKNWKQKNPYWGCVNNPVFQKVFLDKSYQLVKLGAYGLFVDDSRLNEQTTDWGGCMCDYCIKGFTAYMDSTNPGKVPSDFNYKKYLLGKGFTKSSFVAKKNIPLWDAYKSYQEESVVVFLKKWKKSVRENSNKNIIFLANNYKGAWTNIYSQFDVGIAEVPANGMGQDFVTEGIATAKKLNKKQFYTFSSDNEADNVRAVLDLYQAGSSLVIPWDVYVDLKSRQKPNRYFGNPAIYAPLYDLVRKRTLIEEVKMLNNLDLTARQSLSAIATNANTKGKYSKVVKIEFEKNDQLNTVNINNKNVTVLYPKDSSSIIKTKSNTIRIDTKSKVLVLKYGD